MRIDASGNVGIGTSSPTVELDVRDDGANGICNIGVRGGTNGAGAVQISGHGTTYGSTSFDIIQNSAGGYVYNRANLPVIFGTNNTERMRITSDGVLQINAVARQTMAEFNNRQNGAVIEFGHENNGGQYYGTLGVFGTNGHPYIGFSTDCESSADTFTTRGVAGNIITGDIGNGSLKFMQVTSSSATGQTPVERMRIDSSGNLMVGTTSTANIGTHTPNIISSAQVAVRSGTNIASFGLDRIHFDSSNYYVLNASSVGVRLVNGATAWTAQSDENLKENIVEQTDRDWETFNT